MNIVIQCRNFVNNVLCLISNFVDVIYYKELCKEITVRKETQRIPYPDPQPTVFPSQATNVVNYVVL